MSSGVESGIDMRGAGVTELRGAEVLSGVRRHSTEPGPPGLPLCPDRGSGLSRNTAEATHSALVHPGTQSDSRTHSLPWRERVGHGKSVHFDQADRGSAPGPIALELRVARASDLASRRLAFLPCPWGS